MQAQAMELRSAFDALRRRDEGRQRQLDIVLTRELRTGLKLQAAEVRGDSLT